MTSVHWLLLFQHRSVLRLILRVVLRYIEAILQSVNRHHRTRLIAPDFCMRLTGPHHGVVHLACLVRLLRLLLLRIIVVQDLLELHLKICWSSAKILLLIRFWHQRQRWHWDQGPRRCRGRQREVRIPSIPLLLERNVGRQRIRRRFGPQHEGRMVMAAPEGIVAETQLFLNLDQAIAHFQMLIPTIEAHA